MEQLVIKYQGVNDLADSMSFDLVQLGLLQWAHSPLRFLRCTAPGPRTSPLGKTNRGAAASAVYATRLQHCLSICYLPISRCLCCSAALLTRQSVTNGSLLFWLLETKHEKHSCTRTDACTQSPPWPPPERVPWLLQITQFFKDGAEVEIRLINQNLKLHPAGWEN